MRPIKQQFFAETYSIGKGTTNTVLLVIWLVVVRSTDHSFGADNVPPTHQPKPQKEKHYKNAKKLT